MDATTELDLLAALEARMKRVKTTAGYFTNAGENVHVQRTRFSQETDPMPLITVVMITGDFEEQSLQPQTWRQETEFLLVGAIAANTEQPLLPIQLLLDMKKAALQPLDDDDVLSNCVDRLSPVKAIIYHAEEGEPITEVHLIVRASWCDEILEY